MEDHYPITIFKKNQLFIYSWDIEVECKFSSKNSQENRYILMSKPPIRLMLWKLKYKIEKAYLPTNKDSTSLDNNSKMQDLYPITIFKKNQLFIYTWDPDVECKFSSKNRQENRYILMSKPPIRLMMWKLKYKIKKVSIPINKESPSLDNNSKMEELYRITIFNKNLLFI